MRIFTLPELRSTEGQLFKGLTCAQIAARPGGLAWMKSFVVWSEKKSKCGWIAQNFSEYLERPEVQAALTEALKQDAESRKKRAIARNRAASSERQTAYEMKCRAEAP